MQKVTLSHDGKQRTGSTVYRVNKTGFIKAKAQKLNPKSIFEASLM